MSHIKAFFLSFCLLPLIAGCYGGYLISPEERAQRQQMQAEQEQREREVYRERLASSCDGIGFKRGTDAHANCILSQHQQRQQQIMQVLPLLIQQQQQEQQDEAARRRALYPPTPAYTLPPVYNTNCTRDSFGTTNCTTTRQ